MATTVKIEITMDDSTQELFGCLSALRSWEKARPEILMAIAVNAPGMKASDLRDVLQSITPPLPVVFDTTTKPSAPSH